MHGSACRFIVLGVLGLLAAVAQAGEATIAVAANFRSVALELGETLGEQTGHQYTVVSGSTGKLYAQIVSGAPFDVFMAADLERPEKLAAAGIASKHGVQVYAVGQLALWRPGHGATGDLMDLGGTGVGRIALANPRLAPYGEASVSWLKHQDFWTDIERQLVWADNVGAAHGLVATGAAKAGVVSLSTLLAASVDPVQYAVLPSNSYPLIEQGMVLMTHASANPAAVDWFDAIAQGAFDRLLSERGFGSPGDAQ